MPLLPIIPKRELMKLGKVYQEVAGILDWPDKDFYAVADTVSLWSPAEHLYHLAVANKLMLGNIETLYVGEDSSILKKGGPNWNGKLIFLFGKIPRGKGKAPAILKPNDDLLKDDVIREITESKKSMAFVGSKLPALLDVKGRLAHPNLGEFNAVQWLRFAVIHSNHHLRIIKEIPGAPSLMDMRDR